MNKKSSLEPDCTFPLPHRLGSPNSAQRGGSQLRAEGGGGSGPPQPKLAGDRIRRSTKTLNPAACIIQPEGTTNSCMGTVQRLYLEVFQDRSWLIRLSLQAESCLDGRPLVREQQMPMLPRRDCVLADKKKKNKIKRNTRRHMGGIKKVDSRA